MQGWILKDELVLESVRDPGAPTYVLDIFTKKGKRAS
jgi:hypothetical protein